MNNALHTLSAQAASWLPAGEIPGGMSSTDMPGDKVLIQAAHLQKANILFPSLLPLLIEALRANKHERAVISICGGSGTGKSETALLIAYYLRQLGADAYALSGDNYPHRIPKYNDIERLNVFRTEGIRELIARGMYTNELREKLAELQKTGADTDAGLVAAHPWLAVYQQGGDCGLRGYLGTEKEINFAELSDIIKQFKNGADRIFLKRMGREEGTTWYEAIDFRNTSVLIIEWTHSNSDYLRGVDIPVLLWSTPQETLAYRRARGRDKGVDSPFVTRVLNIERDLLFAQAHRAKLIVSSQCQIITHNDLFQTSGRNDNAN
ncbi:MAG: ATP-binding protein [Treponema sp.]|nr:ATP-binding protein [Treponema sp.]